MRRRLCPVISFHLFGRSGSVNVDRCVRSVLSGVCSRNQGVYSQRIRSSSRRCTTLASANPLEVFKLIFHRVGGVVANVSDKANPEQLSMNVGSLLIPFSMPVTR